MYLPERHQLRKYHKCVYDKLSLYQTVERGDDNVFHDQREIQHIYRIVIKLSANKRYEIL